MMNLSILIPIYNEEKVLPALLERLAPLRTKGIEILFSDGGSVDNSLPLLEAGGWQVISGAKGRGQQCNLAARHATGDVFFFLHCDSILSPDAPEQILRAVEQGARWGCLSITFDQTRFPYNLGIILSNFRAKVGHIVFGDQGIFMTRALFQQLDGFPPLPIMEDYELSLRLKKAKIAPAVLPCLIVASVRRFEAGGPWRVGFKMYYYRYLYRRGVAPDVIQQKYKNCR